MFSENCNQRDVVTNFISDGFKKDSSPPIYDEYDGDYLDSVLKQPPKDIASNGLITKSDCNS